MDTTISTIKTIKARHCVRAFLDKPVAPDLINTMLEAARFAPSGVNTQPWKVAVVTGQTQQAITDAILAHRQQSQTSNPDYHYYPDNWFEPYTSRRKACGLALYGALHISKEDIEKRLVAWNNNYRFFGAPVALFFFVEAKLEKGSWLDMGMFIQNTMLAALDLGLATCPQAALAEYPDVIREHLKISADYQLICGMAVGYADLTAPINQYRTEREPVEHFTSWYD